MSFELELRSSEGHGAAECARRLQDAGADIVGINCLRNPGHTSSGEGVAFRQPEVASQARKAREGTAIRRSTEQRP